jgi:hypothetical protein
MGSAGLGHGRGELLSPGRRGRLFERPLGLDAQFGGMKADDVKRLKEFEVENQRLKRIVADQVLEVAALKEIAKGRMKSSAGWGRCVFAACCQSAHSV